jgi:RIP metalloprotease RseP
MVSHTLSSVDVTSTIRGLPDGGTEAIEQLRPGLESPTELSREPQQTDPTVSSKVTSDVSSSPPSLGVYLSPNLLRVEKVRRTPPILAARLAWQCLWDMYSEILDGVLTLLSNFVTRRGPPQGQSIAGAIGIIKQGSAVVAMKDWTAVSCYVAMLSVNFGAMNALPMPPLDGGELIFVLAEALMGRKVNRGLHNRIRNVGFLFLLCVTVSAAVGDVRGVLSGLFR